MKINPQKIYPKKEKEVKSHYRKVNGKLIRIEEFRRKYPHKPDDFISDVRKRKDIELLPATKPVDQNKDIRTLPYTREDMEKDKENRIVLYSNKGDVIKDKNFAEKELNCLFKDKV